MPVSAVQFSTYVISGLMAALAGIAITLLTGSGNAAIGDQLTLSSITAVVIGGTALSGGVGGSRARSSGRSSWAHPEHHFVCQYRYLVADLCQRRYHRRWPWQPRV